VIVFVSDLPGNGTLASASGACYDGSGKATQFVIEIIPSKIGQNKLQLESCGKLDWFHRDRPGVCDGA
jgi:hypothetical protein